ncbi:MAG: Ig-like domain-containing protein, partial [Methanobacterium paludis]|nr:Ig-like domain-containing protein [Methanobacterium paludis]
VNGSALTKYTSPISIDSTNTLSYIAMDSINSLYSPIYTQTYTIDAKAPTVTANTTTCIFNTTQNVNLTATDDTSTTIYYTTDDSDPQTSSTRIFYTGTITISNTTTLKYSAVDAAGNWATPQTQIYTIDTIPPTVTVNETTGMYNTNQSVTLTATDDTNTTIYYTTDGSDPTVDGTVYTVPITVGNTTLRYAAVDAAGNVSPIYTQNYAIDTAVPTVKVVDPASSAVNVAVNKVIKVTFSEAIKLGNSWIELVSSNGTSIPISWSINGSVLTVTADSTLAHGVKYTLLIHTGSVTDLAGNNVAGYVSRFTTSTDVTVPAVKTVDPTNNAVNVAANKVIKVTFSEAIKAGNSWIELVNNNGTVVPSTWSISGNVLTIKANSTLTHGVKYMVLIHTGSVTDLAGNSVKGYVSRFTVDTVAPTVKTVDPVSNALKVATSKVIKVTFSEAIKAGNGSIELVSSNGTVVPVKCSVSGSVLTITPSSALSKGVKYMVLIHTGSVTDLAGNNVAGYVTRFTTTA